LLPPTKVPTGTIKLQLDTEHVESSHNEDNPDSIQLEGLFSIRRSFDLSDVLKLFSFCADSQTSRTTSAVFAKPVARSLEDVVAQYKQTSQNTSRITPGLVPGGLVHSKKKKFPEPAAGLSGPSGPHFHFSTHLVFHARLNPKLICFQMPTRSARLKVPMKTARRGSHRPGSEVTAKHISTRNSDTDRLSAR
jgi:hypothetical protein